MKTMTVKRNKYFMLIVNRICCYQTYRFQAKGEGLCLFDFAENI